MKILAVIPARYQSTRFPGKPLVDINGKSMIQRVYEQASKAASVDQVVVATDDQRIFDHVEGFGGKVAFTSPEHQSGTDRCAEVSQKAEYKKYEAVINVQGDEPYIQPEQIDKVGVLLREDHKIVSLRKQIKDQEQLESSNVVKCVTQANNNALYFSRYSIPFVRDLDSTEILKLGNHYKHIGIYGYEVKTLLELSNLPVGSLEKMESLEQLRWLEAGYSIHMGLTDLETIGVDTPEDINKLLTM